MSNRVDLQAKLERILGSRNVYYQPPETVKINYPAIVYSKDNITSRYADDQKYSKMDRYEIIVIDKKPDNDAINSILELPYSSFSRHYTSDNLHHDVLSLHY
jgi:hypothetical protein